MSVIKKNKNLSIQNATVSSKQSSSQTRLYRRQLLSVPDSERVPILACQANSASVSRPYSPALCATSLQPWSDPRARYNRKSIDLLAKCFVLFWAVLYFIILIFISILNVIFCAQDYYQEESSTNNRKYYTKAKKAATESGLSSSLWASTTANRSKELHGCWA